MKKIMQWVMAATLTTCGASVMTSCAGNGDNPVDSPDEQQPSAGFSVKSIGWTEYEINDDWTESEEAFEVTVPAGSSFYFKALKTRYLDDYRGMSISQMATALMRADTEASGRAPQIRQGSQTCFDGVSMNGDYVAYVFETSADGKPTGRYAKSAFTVAESDKGAYYTGPMERRTDWTVTLVGEPYEEDKDGWTQTYIDIEVSTPGIGYYTLEVWDEFILRFCSDMTVDGLMGNLQADYRQLFTRFNPYDIMSTNENPCKRLNLTGCLATDPAYLLEFDEHGNATGRYNVIDVSQAFKK